MIRLTVPILMLLATGCATTQSVFIDSDPPGALIEINDDYKGLAPLTVTLEGGASKRYSIKALGHEEMLRPYPQGCCVVLPDTREYSARDLPTHLVLRPKVMERQAAIQYLGIKLDVLLRQRESMQRDRIDLYHHMR